MSLLVAKGLELTANVGGRRTAVLDDIGFELGAGEILGIVGESGAGKSMIGRVISQLLPAGFRVTSGTLRFEEEDLLSISPARRKALLGDRVAFIPQEPLSGLNPVLTIRDQFREHLGRLRVPRAEHRDRAIELLSAMKLPRPAEILDRYSFQLSGGMCQRVLIAMAFASNPALLIADEPTTALDVITQAHIVDLVRELNRRHRTGIVFITHDLRLAARTCDKILVLYAGQVIESGPARSIFADSRHPYTRALQLANPSLAGPRRLLISLPEQMPGLSSLSDIPGCRFGPRCSSADPQCKAHPQALRQVGPGHLVRCSPICEAAARQLYEAQLPPAPSAPMEARAILKLVGVSKRFTTGRHWHGGRRPEVTAVKQIDLEVREGEFVGIVGESGSGKSTVARLVMGLETPSAGRILFDGVDVAGAGRAAWKRRIATAQLVFQDPVSSLNPRRRVANLITQALETSLGWTAGQKQERGLALASETGLPRDVLGRYPHQLSGGQKQRVNIARALCIAPRLLVADEIVSGLDVSVQAQILNLLLRLREERKVSLLFISHDLSVVRYLCSRVLVMYRGEMVESGSTDDIFKKPSHPYTQALLQAVPPDELQQQWAIGTQSAL